MENIFGWISIIIAFFTLIWGIYKHFHKKKSSEEYSTFTKSERGIGITYQNFQNCKFGSFQNVPSVDLLKPNKQNEDKIELISDDKYYLLLIRDLNIAFQKKDFLEAQSIYEEIREWLR